MKRVVITGSNGFIGSHLTKHFCDRDYKVIGLDRPTTFYPLPIPNNYTYFPLDLPDPIFIEKLSEWKPSFLIHTAGNSSVPNSVTNPLGDFSGSVVVFYNILDAVRKVSPETKVIILSSAAVYGNPEGLPVSENHPVKPISPYGFHKLLCEDIAREFYLLYKLNVCSVRIFSAYGNGLRKQVVWDIVNKALNDPIVLLSGTGKESRDFIIAEDIAKGIEIIAKRGTFSGEVYNLASGKETSIEELAKLILTTINLSKEIRFSGSQRKGDPINWRADVQKIQSIGFYPSTSIEEGISQVVKWIIDELKQE